MDIAWIIVILAVVFAVAIALFTAFVAYNDGI